MRAENRLPLFLTPLQEPFPIRWKHLTGKKWLQIQTLEQFLFVQIASI
jgi:hypothetical protein